MNEELRAAAAAYESAIAAEARASACFNAALDAAIAELDEGVLETRAGERALRWIPGGADATQADPAESYVIAGAAHEPARGNPPRAIVELCARHDLPALIDAWASESARADDAAAAFLQAPCKSARDVLEKAAVVAANPACGSEIASAVEAARALLEVFAEEYAVAPPGLPQLATTEGADPFRAVDAGPCCG